jgi:hypothetical protein
MFKWLRKIFKRRNASMNYLEFIKQKIANQP